MALTSTQAADLAAAYSRMSDDEVRAHLADAKRLIARWPGVLDDVINQAIALAEADIALREAVAQLPGPICEGCGREVDGELLDEYTWLCPSCHERKMASRKLASVAEDMACEKYRYPLIASRRVIRRKEDQQ